MVASRVVSRADRRSVENVRSEANARNAEAVAIVATAARVVRLSTSSRNNRNRQATVPASSRVVIVRRSSHGRNAPQVAATSRLAAAKVRAVSDSGIVVRVVRRVRVRVQLSRPHNNLRAAFRLLGARVNRRHRDNHR